MTTGIEIWVVPFFGQGHLFPCMELCKHFASRNCRANLIIPSNLSSSVPSSFRENRFIEVTETSSAPEAPPEPGAHPLQHHIKQHGEIFHGIEKLLLERSERDTRPVCAVLDAMMGWMEEIFGKFGILTVGFFTSSACFVAMEAARWKNHPLDVKAGETRLLPGLPEEMGIWESDLKRGPNKHSGGSGPGFPHIPPGTPAPRIMASPEPGEQPSWIEEFKDSIGLMINTCHDLERPFLDYLVNQFGKPVWGVGPLLPEKFWQSANSVIHDREIRCNRKSNVTEDEVIEWLDSKEEGSVLYVSFGSEVGPTMEEYPQLADALESSDRPFIWVIQPGSGKQGTSQNGYFPHNLNQKVGERGLIITGWAPQLLILSHPSTGGFLSHCGWNSTMEAIGRGVPFLAWPIRGDQYDNSRLVVRHLKIGYMISLDLSQTVKKDDIGKGIEKLMEDEERKKRAAVLSSRFHHGFPASSVTSLDAFSNLLINKQI